MASSIGTRLAHAWNAFQNAFSQRQNNSLYSGMASGHPGRQRIRVRNERTILASIFVRIAMDVAGIKFRHARVGENDEFQSVINSRLNDCLSLDSNLDQSARALKQDLVMTLFEHGSIAIVPVDTTINPQTSSFDILSLRVGRIITWEPDRVWVALYNEKTGQREDIPVYKTSTAIIENPFYDVMNEYNSTLKRLIRKLALMDAIDEEIGSSKLDLIIQLPYVVKSETRRDQAESRRKSLEDQLSGSKYGIGYLDGTERITQLNRPVENTLVGQTEALKKQVYEELGMTPEVIAGNADEQVMLNYFNSTIEPIAEAITEELTRKFLTRTARTQGQRIIATRDPFKFVPIQNLADIADKFTRNEILSPNEVRSIIGMYPSPDPKADELRNRNIAEAKEEPEQAEEPTEEDVKPDEVPEDEDNQNGS